MWKNNYSIVKVMTDAMTTTKRSFKLAASRGRFFNFSRLQGISLSMYSKFKANSNDGGGLLEPKAKAAVTSDIKVISFS